MVSAFVNHICLLKIIKYSGILICNEDRKYMKYENLLLYKYTKILQRIRNVCDK